MCITRTLLRNVAAMIVGGASLGWYVATALFPLGTVQREALAAALPVAIAAVLVAVLAGIHAFSAPVRRALAAGAARDEEVAARAARAAHRLPAFAAGAVLLASGAASLAVAVAMRRAGMPPDLGAAGAAAAAASAVLAAMLAYSLAAATAAGVFERLGPRPEPSARGTVRGKILVLGLGLNTIGVLLFAATGYVRYRADADREYLASAQRDLEGALVASAGQPDAVLAEHAWIATGASTAVVGPGGGIVARFGSGPAPFDRVAGAAEGALALEGGWLVTRRAPSGATVASWLPEERLQERRAAWWTSLAQMAVVVYGATALLAWLAARAITLPFGSLGRAADRIASGDLTASPPSVSRDEIGRLAADFRRMASGLKGLVVDVQAATEGVSTGAREAGAIGERVRLGALDQHAGVVAVQTAVEAMEGSVALVSRRVGGLSAYVSQATAAMSEMAVAFEEVRRKGAELDRAMEAAARDVEELGAAGRHAESSLGQLETLATHASGTLVVVRASVEALERTAGESEETAQHVAELAERAGGVVEETVLGIEALRAAVSDAHRRITSLGRRSDDIDQVVDFISEVAGRTNLLSLNASIIAAQAGEHGKAFAVVAEQIRELAAQIARSTKSIGDIIHAVREEVEGTAALIDRGDALAVEGVQLARNSLEALGRIRSTTVQGRATAEAIRLAVEAHAHSSREVARVVGSVAEGSRAVAVAVQLVGRSVTGVNSVSRGVSAMADGVARALEEQTGLGQRQLESLSHLETLIREITRAVESHDAATRRVRGALTALSHAAGEHDSAVQGLSGLSERIDARARALADRVGRFKVS